MFNEFPELRAHLWGGEFWSDGYFIRTVGDKVTTNVIRRYTEYHKQEMKQLDLFNDDFLLSPSGRISLLAR